jgi:hypothetical protein
MARELGILAAAPSRSRSEDTCGQWSVHLSRYLTFLTITCQTPLQDVASALDVPIKELGNPHYDDPSLALLFSQLKSKTLQTAKGTSEISGRAEFSFVLQIARVFIRMGEPPLFIQGVHGVVHRIHSLHRVPRPRVGPC